MNPAGHDDPRAQPFEVGASDSRTGTVSDGTRLARSRSDAAGALVGRVLRGTYRIVSLVDEGGMGSVYAAEHVRLHRQVAVKVLARHLARDANALTRFQREAEIVSQLHHPHVVHILDFDTTEAGEPYIVMEFLRGEPLSQRLKREGALAPQVAASIVSQVASGLQTAHQASIVHRDLKPDNIYLLAMEDDSTFVKLLDFGISKSLSAQGTRVTQEFDVLGTPEYMAPEQATGRTATVTHHADQFSLAAIAYEMLTGTAPFSGESVMAILQRIIHHHPVAAHSLAEGVPPAVSSVLGRALAKRPAERYGSACEFASAIAEAVGLEPLGTHSLRPRASLPPGSAARTLSSPTSGSTKDATPEHGSCRVEAERLPLSGNEGRELLMTELESTRRALAFGEQLNAYRHAQRCLAVADTLAADVSREALADALPLLETVLLAQLGGPRQRVRALGTPEVSDTRVTPEHVYLLSRLDGTPSIDEVLDLSPLARVDTLRCLLAFRDQGLLELTRSSSSENAPAVIRRP